jgi:hypothetical protein
MFTITTLILTLFLCVNTGFFKILHQFIIYSFHYCLQLIHVIQHKFTSCVILKTSISGLVRIEKTALSSASKFNLRYFLCLIILRTHSHAFRPNN